MYPIAHIGQFEVFGCLTGISFSTVLNTSSERVAPTSVTCAPSALDGNIGGFLVRTLTARTMLEVASLKESSRRVSASSSTRWVTSERRMRSCCLYFRSDSGVAITMSTGLARASLMNFFKDNNQGGGREIDVISEGLGQVLIYHLVSSVYA